MVPCARSTRCFLGFCKRTRTSGALAADRPYFALSVSRSCEELLEAVLAEDPAARPHATARVFRDLTKPIGALNAAVSLAQAIMTDGNDRL